MKAGKGVLAAVLVVLVLAAGGGAIWYFSVPHTAEEQFAYAQKLDKKLTGESLTKGPKELGAEIQKTVRAYEAVGGDYGKSAKAAEGLKRAAKIEEEIGKDDAKALGELDGVIKDYPGAADAGFALMEEARILRRQGDGLKSGKPEEGAEKYKQAIAKLEEYGKRFGKDPTGKPDAALMEIGRIWQDGFGEPLIRAIRPFEQVVKEFPSSDYRAEALYRLAELYEQAKDFEKALTLYGQLLEEFPHCQWADKALFARGKILADKMNKHEEAAKEFAKLQAEHPNSPLRGAAGGEARAERGKAGGEAGTKYSKGRYGGTVPYDTMRDKPMPPTGMFPEFAKQKLDAQKYDLNVDFSPAEHRITVVGTLKLANGGDVKKRLLLMLGEPLHISKLTVDGKDVKFTHEGETLSIALPTEMKTGAVAMIGFAYTGQYAGPQPTMSGMTEAMRESGLRPPGEGDDLPPAGDETATTGPATGTAPAAKLLAYPYNPQIGLGDYGYALSGAAWYPVTIIGDIFEAHIIIRTPANVEAVANGEIVRRDKSTVEGKQGVFEFNTKEPVFGLYFAYGPYRVEEKEIGPIHYYTYFRPEDAGKGESYVTLANRILSFYAGKFAPFPYEKMALVEVPLPPFLGGVGPASLMFLQEGMVARTGVPENLLAHELAHQWFGNLIPINMADGHYNQWLSEGFATYCDALYTEHTEGSEALAKHMERYEQLFFQFSMMAPPGMGAIKNTFFGSPLYRPVIYEKGAIVLHMLRKVMGDEKFFDLMREYVATYRNKATTVEDFERLANKVYGKDLSWFFAEWIDGSVFAHWKLQVTSVPAAKVGAFPSPVKVTITVEQPDDLVKMPADITLYGAGGEKDVVANVMLDKKEQVVEATAPFVPVKAVIDEEFWVLRHPGSDNIWEAKAAATEKAAP